MWIIGISGRFYNTPYERMEAVRNIKQYEVQQIQCRKELDVSFALKEEERTLLRNICLKTGVARAP